MNSPEFHSTNNHSATDHHSTDGTHSTINALTTIKRIYSMCNILRPGKSYNNTPISSILFDKNSSKIPADLPSNYIIECKKTESWYDDELKLLFLKVSGHSTISIKLAFIDKDLYKKLKLIIRTHTKKPLSIIVSSLWTTTSDTLFETTINTDCQFAVI